MLLETKEQNISIRKIAELTAIREEDIILVLEELHILKYIDGNFIFACDEAVLTALKKKSGGRGGPEVKIDKLLWVPYKFKYA